MWFANNVNERQRLINTMTRGRFNASTGAFETIRDPDYHMIWIVHQLIHGVTSEFVARLAVFGEVRGVRPGPRDVSVRRDVRVRRRLVRPVVQQAVRLLQTRRREKRVGVEGPDGGCHARGG